MSIPRRRRLTPSSSSVSKSPRLHARNLSDHLIDHRLARNITLLLLTDGRDDDNDFRVVLLVEIRHWRCEDLLCQTRFADAAVWLGDFETVLLVFLHYGGDGLDVGLTVGWSGAGCGGLEET